MRKTKFSEFIRAASVDEKSAVYADVMQKASVSQKEVETISLMCELISKLHEAAVNERI